MSISTDSSEALSGQGGRTVVLLGGVPGAGKSTAIAAVVAGRTDVEVIDSDIVRGRLRARLPAGLPYRRFRWLVHTATVLWIFGVLLRGALDNKALLVHDPSTRPRRRAVFARLARYRGWTPALMFIDVTRDDAERGQRDRRRVVRSAAFDRHWARWLDLRGALIEAPADLDGGRWDRVELADRNEAVATLQALLPAPPRPATTWSLVAQPGEPLVQLDATSRTGV